MTKWTLMALIFGLIGALMIKDDSTFWMYLLTSLILSAIGETVQEIKDKLK